ncbi:MAG: hypothetical protein WA960_06045 [Tunicatimonas sp.]
MILPKALALSLFSVLLPLSILAQGIQPSATFPRFWEYEGQPLLLLGGSDEDNLFQYEPLVPHLDALQAAGGNYVRCTMSSRDEGNLWPFGQSEEGTYDLNIWNEAYWQRFADFLQETSTRGIIVQVEVWATFDFYRDNWAVNPFNPDNNINYDPARSKLPTEVPTHPIYTENNFFRSVPTQMSLFKVLEYQQKFVDKLLLYTLKYDHVLYCMDNETSVSADWGRFWSNYIKKAAQETAEKTVYTTEMWDPWDLNHVAHRETFDHPEVYDFVDISQNSHLQGQAHWDGGYRQIQRIHQSDQPRPVNSIKVYGTTGNKFGHTTQDGIERFVRNVLLGVAAVRFHRPDSGLGLGDTARAVIESMRMLTDAYPHFTGNPDLSTIKQRPANAAYGRKTDNMLVLYYPAGGGLEVDLSSLGGELTIRWLDVSNAQWSAPLSVQGGALVQLESPEAGNWIALIQKTR